MKVWELITEANIPPTEYGYWITDKGEIIPVVESETLSDSGGKPTHVSVAREYLKLSQIRSDVRTNVMDLGWIRVVVGGIAAETMDGEFNVDAVTRRAIRSLVSIAKEQEEVGQYRFDWYSNNSMPNHIIFELKRDAIRWLMKLGQ